MRVKQLDEQTAHLQLSNSFGGRVLVTLQPPKRERILKISDTRAKQEFERFVKTLQQSITDAFGVYAGYRPSTILLSNISIALTDIMSIQEAAQGFFFNIVKPYCTITGFDHVGMNIRVRIIAPVWMIELINKTEKNNGQNT